MDRERNNFTSFSFPVHSLVEMTELESVSKQLNKSLSTCLVFFKLHLETEENTPLPNISFWNVG